MASRNFREVQAVQRELKIICGTVTTGADGVVSATEGLGYTAANGAEGVYTITFDDNYSEVMCAFATDVNTTATDSAWHIDADAAGSVAFNRLVAGSAADLDNGEFKFFCIVANSDTR